MLISYTSVPSFYVGLEFDFGFSTKWISYARDSVSINQEVIEYKLKHENAFIP